MFGYAISLAMVKTDEKTRVRKVMVLPQDSSGPEDVGVIIGSGKDGSNIGCFVKHKEWEQSLDEFEVSRQLGALSWQGLI